MKKLKKVFLCKYKKRVLVFAGIISIIITNIYQISKEEALFRQLSLYTNKKSPTIIGAYFKDIKSSIQGVEYAGYYTNRDLSKPKNNQRYSQAQFVLAPTILDIKNLNHKFVIIDCTDKAIAKKKLKQLHAIPIKINRYGIIVAEKIFR